MHKRGTLKQWLDHLEQRHPTEIELGLTRVRQVWEALGAPQPAPTCITVAGTNGKGSTVAWLEAMGRAHGTRVGSYSSPHLFRFNERLHIDGSEQDDAGWVQALAAVEQAREEVGLSYFEHTTLAAFLIMQQSGLDWAVLEVGLGGRLDAVNIIDADLAVITPIDLDHQQWLGEGREQIAREKAGILRPGQDLILSDRSPPESLLQAAGEMSVRVYRIGQQFDVTINPPTLTLAGRSMEYPETLPVRGAHQADNLAAAAMAWQLLAGQDAATPRWSDVLDRFSLAGRIQTVTTCPQTVVDVGHNPQAAKALLATLDDGHADWQIVLGMLADKDAAAFVDILMPLAGHWHLCALPGSRGQSAGDLRSVAALPGNGDSVSLHDSVADGLKAARCGAGSQGRVLVTGSFHTVNAALQAGILN